MAVSAETCHVDQKLVLCNGLMWWQFCRHNYDGINFTHCDVKIHVMALFLPLVHCCHVNPAPPCCIAAKYFLRRYVTLLPCYVDSFYVGQAWIVHNSVARSVRLHQIVWSKGFSLSQTIIHLVAFCSYEPALPFLTTSSKRSLRESSLRLQTELFLDNRTLAPLFHDLLPFCLLLSFASEPFSRKMPASSSAFDADGQSAQAVSIKFRVRPSKSTNTTFRFGKLYQLTPTKSRGPFFSLTFLD